MDTVADLQAARRYLTAFLLNVDMDVNEMRVSTLLNMLDHFAEYPNEYLELINGRKNS